MALISNTKKLAKATPTVRAADGVCTYWRIEAVLTNPDDGWYRRYEGEEDVAYLGKQPNEFTADELMKFLPDSIDIIFDAHWRAHNEPPAEDVQSDFDLSDLAS